MSRLPAPRDDESLFERFRRHGDLHALGELFERTAPAVLRVALHLSRDPATAEDLLQATFLRAIEARDEWDGARPLLPWLCGILQNRARHERWHAGRTPDAARLLPAPVADPAAAAVQAEFDAAVDAAIADLPEVYRPVLRLHLAYGQSPAAIAHALDRPPATVRSQLARGLEQLRRVLPAGLAGMAALAWTAERGLAAVKHAVLVKAQVVVPVVAAGTVVGGVLTMKKLVSVAVAALVAAGLWLAWPRPDVVVPDVPPNANGAVPVAANVAPTASGTATDANTQPSREAIAAPSAATTGTLRITCRFAEDGTPARGVQVSIAPEGLRDGEMAQRSLRTDDAGIAVAADVRAGKWTLAADRGGSAFAEVVTRDVCDVELVIPTGVFVRGRVLDELDVPIAGASIWLSRRAHDYCNGTIVAVSNSAGQYELRAVELERFVSATAAGKRSAVVRPVRGGDGRSLELDLVLKGAGATLAGTVVDADGLPCAEARVYVGWHELGSRWTSDMFAEHRPPVEVRTDARGAFVVHGLAADSKQAVWVRAPSHCLWHERVSLTNDTPAHIRVALQRGAFLSGRVTNSAGQPVAEAGVGYRSLAWHDQRIAFHDFRGPSWSFYGAVTDESGRYEIACITPGLLRLNARKDDIEGEGQLTVADGEHATWDGTLIERVIRGRVVDARGAPLAAVDVTAYPPRGRGNIGSGTSDADGRFVCATLAAVPHLLTFYLTFPKSRGSARVQATTVRGVMPSAEEVVVRVPDAAFSVGTLRGRWLDVHGAPLHATVRASGEGQRDLPQVDTDPATGEFLLGPLPAGTWRVKASCKSDWRHLSPWSERLELRAGEVHDLGTMRMPATGWIDVAATGPDGEPLDLHSVALEDSTGWSEMSWMVGQLDRGKLRIDNVSPGAYRVRVDGTRNLASGHAPAVVVAGAGTTVAVQVTKGVSVELVATPITEPVPMHLDFVWTRDGALFERYDNCWEANGERQWTQRLLPGAYELTVTSETGKRAVNHFTIAANDPDGLEIAIQLP